MAKNVLIFSDGTGQAGGLIPDELRSNVYKLYRATRCGPDSCIDPEKQLAFYDPGLGSKLGGVGQTIGWMRWIYNILSQATGLGITRNIIDCYAAIIRLYEPGDHIYLFGFSRGAYTVRCVGGVLGLCGVPIHRGDGGQIRRDEKSIRAIAKEAVTDVYQHGSGVKAKRFENQRSELAQRFRATYGSGTAEQSNEVPYFIGVWDTVAALGASWPRLIAFGLSFAAIVWTIMAAAWWVGRDWLSMPSYWNWIATTVGFILLAVWAIYVLVRVKWACGLTDPWWKTIHITQWRMRFYNTSLNPRVQYAKHAQSIDENRKDFDRVPWTDHGARSNEDAWFEQVWFAGNHSDIGGGYAENESRLSDVALQWMVDKAQKNTSPLVVDGRCLNLFPSASGMQHDARNSGLIPWEEGLRKVPTDAPLHETVLVRFKLPQVLIYDVMRPYRPEPLRNHKDVSQFY